MKDADELIEQKDLVAHVCSLAMGFGVTGRADVKREYEDARKELYAHIETLEARVATAEAERDMWKGRAEAAVMVGRSLAREASR